MTQRQYTDFKLFLTRPPDGQMCQVALLPTPEVGETVTPVIVSADKGPAADSLPLVASKGITCCRAGCNEWFPGTGSAHLERTPRTPASSTPGEQGHRRQPHRTANGITMQYEVIDTHAIAFTKAFYGALASGLSLDEAMTAGRLAMYGVSSAQLDQLESL